MLTELEHQLDIHAGDLFGLSELMGPGVAMECVESVMSLLVKIAGQLLPSMEIVLFRGILTLAMSYVIVKRARIEPILGLNRRLLIQRGVLGAAALACFLFSLTHLPLAESTLIQYMNPVFAIMVSHLWFGESAGRG